MNRKLVLFTILFVCQSLIHSAYDDCSAFTCSNLKVETGEKCYLTGSKCQVHNDDCTKIESEEECNSNILFKELKYKCFWDGTSCTRVERKCEDYSPSLGVACKDLKTADNTKICVLDGKTETCSEQLKSAYGCSSTDSEDSCKAQIPIDQNNKIEPLKKCVLKGNICSSELKECEDHKKELDDCVSLLTSDNTNTKKRCFPSDNSCAEKNIKCEGYNDDVTNADNRSEANCKAITPYIIKSDDSIEKDEFSKCELIDKSCKTVKKLCSEITDPIICANHVLDDNKKRCVYKNSCIEQYKTCDLYNQYDANKDKTGCEAIEEDSSHKCIFISNKCENKLKECKDVTVSASCNLISLNNTHKCSYVDSECIEQYKTCNLYTGNDIIKCETIIPSEKNMRCILKDDNKCVSVPRECEEHTEDNEYECINNYKPLDENYICAFNKAKEVGKKCVQRLKYEYEYCYLGDEDKNTCESIKPKNNDENDSIKCSYDNTNGKCIRIEKPCSDGKSAKECSLIIPKNSKKICIWKKENEQSTSLTCNEQYKTCEDFNNDKDDEETNTSTLEEKCKGIISIDGKQCKYTPATAPTTRGTCSGEAKSCSEFDSDEFENACISIPLNDITKKCVYESGDCKLETKSCSELVFNGNESGIEEKCNKAKVSDKNNVCISSSDKKSCIEVDKSIAPKDIASPTTKPNGGSQNNEKSGTNTGTNKGQEQETDNNFGKEIYLNKLFIIILCLLF